MAKIRDANPKQVSGGYERLVGNKALADIFTKAQSTVISNGTELEKIISTNSNLIIDLDKFIDECDTGNIADGAYLCTKKVVKASSYKLVGHEPDFIAFTVDTSKNICYVVELKDGDSFDTKKSIAEKEMLQLFVNHLAPKIPFRTKFYICCFNQLDKEKIVSGFKNVFTIDEVMTGKEFCDILNIDYDMIVAMRKEDTSDNFQYIVEKLFEIETVRSGFTNKHRKHIPEDEFYNEEDPLPQPTEVDDFIEPEEDEYTSTTAYTRECRSCGKPYYQETEDQVPGFRMMDEDICPYCGFENGRSMQHEHQNYKMSERQIKEYFAHKEA